MGKIVACVDGSAYSLAVCEFAALFADRLEAEVGLIVVDEPGWPAGAADRAARMAGARMHDHGFDRFSIQVSRGPFLDCLTDAAAQAELIVMGKRGLDRSPTLSHLGTHVEPVLRRLGRPTCLVSQLFLPLSRALVLLDSDPAHRAAMQFATTSPLLKDLRLELLLMDDGRHLAQEKLAAARESLAVGQGSAFSIPADNADKAVGAYTGGADLMVMSREMLFDQAGSDLLPGDEESFWRRRTPILVC